MASQHDDELEEIFLRRRMGITARRQLDTDDHASFEGAVAKFPAAIKLPPEGGTGVASRLYPLLGLSMEPGTVLPTGQHRVGYTLKSPTAGMRFEVEAWFWVTVGEPEGHQSDAGYRVLSGDFPAGCVAALPTSLHLPSRSASPLRRELRSLDRDGTRAWEQDFFAAIKPMLFSIVGETMRNRHPLKIESSDEWGRAMETAVKGGLMFSSPERTSVNWTNWANRNIRRDVVREQDKRSGRSHADQSIRRFAVAKMPTATDSELHEAAADLYVAWTFENAYRKAKKATPELTLDEFKARNVEPSKTISLDRFRRALEPVPTTAPLSEIGELADQPVVDHVRDADALVDTLTEVRTQLGGSLVDGDSLRLWLVRRGVVEARTNQEWEDARRLDLTHLEAQVFEPWQGADLRWQRRKDRSVILALARTSLDDLAITG